MMTAAEKWRGLDEFQRKVVFDDMAKNGYYGDYYRLPFALAADVLREVADAAPEPETWPPPEALVVAARPGVFSCGSKSEDSIGEIVGWNPRARLVLVDWGWTDWWHSPKDLEPSTPAARDLLAEIRAGGMK